MDISLICGATIGPLLKKENKVSQFWDDKKIVGDVDLTLLKEESRALYWDADFFINGEWKPEEYIEINKEVNQPEYEANVGSVIKDSWPIGRNNTLYLECKEINESFLESPIGPVCSLQVNNSFMINDSVRSEFVCDDNIGHTAHFGGAIGGYLITLLRNPELIQEHTLMTVLLAIPIVILFGMAKMGKL